MYSLDFRRLAVSLYKAGMFKTYRHASQAMHISTSTLHRWVHSTDLLPKRRRSLTGSFYRAKDFIRTYVAQNPFTTIRDICNALRCEKQITISVSTCASYVKRLGITRKKAFHHHPLYLDDAHHATFKHTMVHMVESGKEIVSLDECSFSERILQNYGYCSKGLRIDTSLQPKGWKTRSLLTAISNMGWMKYIVVNGGVKRPVFVEFLSSIPKDVTIVLDNCSIHKVNDARLLFTPTYSPQFNPVEMTFSKMKNKFRRSRARGLVFDDALATALQCVSSDDIVGYFRHVYRICKPE